MKPCAVLCNDGRDRGALQLVLGFEHTKLAGRVDSDGSFCFGGESTVAQDTLLNLWEGTFHNNSLTFTRRSTLLSSGRVVNTMKTTGVCGSCPKPIFRWRTRLSPTI